MTGDRGPERGDGAERPALERWTARGTLLLLAAVAGASLGTYALSVELAVGGPGPRGAGPGGLLGWAAGLLEGVSGAVLVGAALAAAAVLCAGLHRGPAEARRRLRRFGGHLASFSRWVAGGLRRVRSGESRGHLFVLAAAVAGGAALRLLHLDQPVRYDEAFTWTHFASKPLSVGLSTYTYPNNHLFHTLTVRASTALFGSGPAALRLPAFVAGCLVVPATYGTLRLLYGGRVGLVAASLVAASSPLVLYSANARGYSFVVLAFLLLAALAVRLADRRDPAAWAAFCGVAALGLWTVPITLYPLGAVLLWLLVSAARGRGRGLRRVAREAGGAAGVTAVLAAALYLPAVQGTGLEALVANRFVEPASLADVATGLPGFLADLWGTWTRGMPGVTGSVLGGLAAAGLLLHRFEARRPASLPAAALLWTAVLLLLTRRVPPYPRIWIFLLPLFAAAVGVAVAQVAAALEERLGRSPAGEGDGQGRAAGGRPAGRQGTAERWGRLAVPAAAAGLLALLSAGVVAGRSVYRSDATGAFRDGGEVARFLAERVGPEDAVVVGSVEVAVLEYWFARMDVPQRLLTQPPGEDGTSWLVVNRRRGQDPRGTLYRAGQRTVDRARAGEPLVRLASFDYTDVYAVRPPDDGEEGARKSGGEGDEAPGGESPEARRGRRGGQGAGAEGDRRPPGAPVRGGPAVDIFRAARAGQVLPQTGRLP